MKKYPRWAFLAAGVVVTVTILYFYGKHKMKQQQKVTASGGTVQPVQEPAAAVKLAGPVVRVNN